MEPGTIIDAQHPPQPTPETQTPQNHIKHSHRLLLLYLAILLVAALCGSIYAWQHQKVNTLTNKNMLLTTELATLSSQVQILSAPQPGATNNNSPLVYKDWKTYCDSINSACFKYPKEWNIDVNSDSNKATATIKSPDNTVTIRYNEPVTSQILNQVFYMASIKDLNKTDLGLNIVGRAAGNTPDYVIVDKSYLSSNSIVVGKSLSFMDDARFTAKTTKASAQLNAQPSDAVLSNIKSTDQAIAWFNSSNAKTSLLILQSLYYQ